LLFFDKLNNLQSTRKVPIYVWSCVCRLCWKCVTSAIFEKTRNGAFRSWNMLRTWNAWTSNCNTLLWWRNLWYIHQFFNYGWKGRFL